MQLWNSSLSITMWIYLNRNFFFIWTDLAHINFHLTMKSSFDRKNNKNKKTEERKKEKESYSLDARQKNNVFSTLLTLDCWEVQTHIHVQGIIYFPEDIHLGIAEIKPGRGGGRKKARRGGGGGEKDRKRATGKETRVWRKSTSMKMEIMLPKDEVFTFEVRTQDQWGQLFLCAAFITCNGYMSFFFFFFLP